MTPVSVVRCVGVLMALCTEWHTPNDSDEPKEATKPRSVSLGQATQRESRSQAAQLLFKCYLFFRCADMSACWGFRGQTLGGLPAAGQARLSEQGQGEQKQGKRGVGRGHRRSAQRLGPLALPVTAAVRPVSACPVPYFFLPVHREINQRSLRTTQRGEKRTHRHNEQTQHEAYHRLTPPPHLTFASSRLLLRFSVPPLAAALGCSPIFYFFCLPSRLHHSQRLRTLLHHLVSPVNELRIG
jgi:hypothetical protein